jgi:Protein of unknown function (DUF3047)
MVTHLLLALWWTHPLWNFEGDGGGKLPLKWQIRGTDSSRPTYQINLEPNGNRYLAAVSRGSDVQLGTEVTVRPEEYPLLSWKWRAWELPRGADERNEKTLDSAASIYAVFGSRLFPRILKYVWSTTVPAGSSFKHPSSGRVAIIVVNSGSASLGQWLTVSRNLIDDYKAAFGSKPGNLIAIGLKTDSGSTGSSARADYDDIQLKENVW